MADKKCGSLNPVNLGLASGIVFGLGVFVTVVVNMQFAMWQELMDLVSLYPGVTSTYAGAFLGLFWGFVDAFVGFSLIAWLYNKFNAKCGSC